ncbi:hypothetical protein BGK67_01995 [Streptomyces subrutilus]|uniref:Glycoside hydrolase family 20 catalytic domain-containing protein n=1 Tax=Streptomyces subrutilus TaxID=36818 RepID=A0A1E5PL68_9ACTN|nr:hypothetical protein BGK67_01995 [Streptomyces subrutilus]
MHGGDPEAQAPADGRGRILGTQVQIWTEFAPDAADLDRLAYPRLCVLADRAWTGATPWADFASRLHGHVPRVDALGVRRHPLTAPRTTAATPVRTAPCA